MNDSECGFCCMPRVTLNVIVGVVRVAFFPQSRSYPTTCHCRLDPGFRNFPDSCHDDLDCGVSHFKNPPASFDLPLIFLILLHSLYLTPHLVDSGHVEGLNARQHLNWDVNFGLAVCSDEVFKLDLGADYTEYNRRGGRATSDCRTADGGAGRLLPLVDMVIAGVV
ncbi:hypothetical protein BT67DRAFT_440782 [Trichocladium antarcticum]|uniref:Uncharacterized protein n=1 Tax=Trichocladium antarcticum TaxID=1450529 RepID=A0AAN6ZFL6_9PEZI|nr:hypothetical protein BT67DRAFT_440782 [Trichocladium antarcticum]